MYIRWDIDHGLYYEQIISTILGWCFCNMFGLCWCDGKQHFSFMYAFLVGVVLLKSVNWIVRMALRLMNLWKLWICAFLNVFCFVFAWFCFSWKRNGVKPMQMHCTLTDKLKWVLFYPKNNPANQKLMHKIRLRRIHTSTHKRNENFKITWLERIFRMHKTESV